MPRHGELIVEAVVNGPFVENCYIVADAASGQGIVVDPGDEEQLIADEVRRLGVAVQLIVCTHAHVDHVGAVAPLRRRLGAPFALHPAERPGLAHVPRQAALFGLGEREVPEVDRDLVAGETVAVGGRALRVLFTPGHSAGGCCLYFAEERVLLAGDTLFAAGIGRTDLPGGSLPTLLAAIQEQLLTLPDDVVVYSGHGPATTIGAERRGNPYLQPGAFV